MTLIAPPEITLSQHAQILLWCLSSLDDFAFSTQKTYISDCGCLKWYACTLKQWWLDWLFMRVNFYLSNIFSSRFSIQYHAVPFLPFFCWVLMNKSSCAWLEGVCVCMCIRVQTHFPVNLICLIPLSVFSTVLAENERESVYVIWSGCSLWFHLITYHTPWTCSITDWVECERRNGGYDQYPPHMKVVPP